MWPFTHWTAQVDNSTISQIYPGIHSLISAPDSLITEQAWFVSFRQATTKRFEDIARRNVNDAVDTVDRTFATVTGAVIKHTEVKLGVIASGLNPHLSDLTGSGTTTDATTSRTKSSKRARKVQETKDVNSDDGDDRSEEFWLVRDIGDKDKNDDDLDALLYDSLNEAEVASASALSPVASSSLSSPSTSWPLGQHATCSKAKLGRRQQRFQSLDRARFWKLQSGRTVEDVMFNASLMESAPVAFRSCTIDFDCKSTKALFTDKEWRELQAHNKFTLPHPPVTTTEYLKQVRRAMLEGDHVSKIPLPEHDRFTCELAMTTCMKWARIYKKDPSPFIADNLSEAYWA
ncbi:hypothetical protein BC939DRAFT_524457 [Gamsiella multidivaricata]|uniref:uncharacterized protein n=1 Tax=Gamsiella multidivaricata TaxID=101098 RepID=UPI00221E4D99|nr:uncharacterized protein BC939DRAFT_524457 [Gamsiella multidivaricata]KAI7832847.1 hypothetical protein BC939DRAFT_524457 [Gamsiella multidivaricata]